MKPYNKPLLRLGQGLVNESPLQSQYHFVE
jgi:hypothetical protein